MKSLLDYIAEKESESIEFDEELSEEIIDEANLKTLPPMVLVMRRESIRNFPNGMQIGLYKIDKLNKYITIPFGGTAMSPVVEEFDDVFFKLEEIVENHLSDRINFLDGSSMRVDEETASAVLKIHDLVNNDNKQKIAEAANRSVEDFRKVVNFAYKHVK